MARSPFEDVLVTYPFWLLDVGPGDGFSLPILTPLFGFSSITAPSVAVETKEIRDGNFPLTKKVVVGGSAGEVTLSRGVVFYDSEFWRWLMMALMGDTSGSKFLGLIPIGGVTYRRDLLLIQYFSHINLNFGVPVAADNAILTAVGTVAGATALSGAASAFSGSSNSFVATTGLLAGATAGLGAAGVGPFEFAARVPARMWLLKGCIPTGWRPSGDFDASSNNVSIAELTLAVNIPEEFSLG